MKTGATRLKGFGGMFAAGRMPAGRTVGYAAAN